MARAPLREIYCWELQLDKLNIYLASTKKGAVRVGLSLSKNMDCLTYFKSEFSSAEIYKDKQINSRLLDGVHRVLKNRPLRGDLPMDISPTLFQMRVWKSIARIPFGQTRTYSEVARMIGMPKGARAVGQAMGRNPLPIIFP